MRRLYFASPFLLLLTIAFHQAQGWQGAVSHSKPGQEDLSFWINHRGLEQIDVEGEVGFGDFARLLMRRRSNSAKMRSLRDRFVFKKTDAATLDTPDVLRGNATYIIAQGRVFNLPALRNGKGYFHRIVEQRTGMVKRNIDGHEVTFDVRPLVKLKVRLEDEKGRPTTARVYLTGADGLGYAPKGTVSRFAALPAEQFFHAREAFEIELPAGETVIEAARGTEYELTRRTVALKTPTEITVRLKRWVNLAERGWYSADAHIHANYTAPDHQDITAEDVRMYMLGEDLHVPNMVVANSAGDTLHDTRYFEGKLSALSTPDYLLYWNEEMRNAGAFGHMCFFNLKKLVEPIYTGFANSKQADDYPANFNQAKAAREQGGAVTYAHPGYAPTFEGASMKEMPVDLALGQIDAMDVLSNNPEEVAIEMWYRLLNCGFRLAISAGTDAFTNVADHYVPGGGRVYAHVEGPLSYEAWVQAYKRGRSFATNGPVLVLKVDGKLPGEELRYGKGPHKVSVKVELKSATPVEQVELVVNGKAQPYTPTLTLERSSWVAARVGGAWNRMVLNDTKVFAHTSPVYVYLGEQPIVSKEDARFWMEWIDKLIERTRQRGRFSNEGRKQEVIELFQKARAIYARQG